MSRCERTLNTIEAGRVTRYHAAPTAQPQTVGLHCYGVLVIIIYLTEGKASSELLQAATLHDSAELFTGDIPYTVKRELPEIKKIFGELEELAHHTVVLARPVITPAEEAVLKLADTLEGLIWCKKTEPSGLVGNRWKESLSEGMRKFSTILPLNVIERARAMSENPNLYPI